MSRKGKDVLLPAGGPSNFPPRADPPATCGDCRHWREKAAGLGLCVVDPPGHVKAVTEFGPLCTYRVTAAAETACSKAAPKLT